MCSRPEKEEKLKNDEIEAQSETSQEISLKRYEAPRLECHWRLQEVIQFGGSPPNDSGATFGPDP